MSLAIFDLDNTLLHGDSDKAWGDFLVEHNLVTPEYTIKNKEFFQQYIAGELDINAYLKFCLQPLTLYPMQELQKLHAQFMLEKVQPLILPKAVELVEEHRRRGDTLLIITATNDFIALPIAQLFNIQDCIATTATIVNNRYTGEVAGTPSFNSGKIIRLQEWLQDKPHLSLRNSYFYSDSINDLPLLQVVTHPVVVNAEQKLLNYALKHNWSSLDFGSPVADIKC